MHAASAGEGQGATFTVELPLSILHPTTAPARVHPRTSDAVPFKAVQTLNGVRVLVVDDEPDTLETVETVLSRCGADVHTAATVEAALDEVTRWHPDLVVSDIGMPGEDGYSLIARLRALGPAAGGNVPAIALTAYARVEDRLRVLTAGFQMHVPKPIEPAELVAVISSVAAWHPRG